MGEVYRARDSRLGREVAIKVLPDEVARDPERLARFQREARALAALNHPHVATLHGLEQHDGKDLLVMELVHGETLADRIARGPMPVDEAIPIFLQIAEGLEAAHEKGIVHRDLKPANIRLGADGASVKILDFGLAKAMAPADSAAGEAAAAGGAAADALTHSPTLTLQATRRGEILGTAQYMSPEQARGLAVDRRTDIWAFGACLYEALAGKPAFVGDDVSSILAAVIRDEPDLGALPDSTPLSVRSLVRHCLAKRPKDRLHNIGDAAVELRDVLSSGLQAPLPSLTAAPSRRNAWWWAVAAAVALAVGGVMVGRASRPEATAAPPVARSVVNSSGVSPYSFAAAGSRLALSPDGGTIAWLGKPGEPWAIYVKRLDQLDATQLQDTEGVNDLAFSPDGAWLAFLDDRTLTKIPTAGGTKVPLCQVPAGIEGMSWGDDDRLYVGSNQGLYRVASGGGALELVLGLDSSKADVALVFPEVLPGARTVLLERRRQQESVTSEIVALDLESDEQRILVSRGGQPRYFSSGHLVFATGDGRLRAVGFEAESLRVHGDPIGVAERVFVGQPNLLSLFAAGAEGSLAYVSGRQDLSLVWVDRAGERTSWSPLGQTNVVYPRLSPDGRRLALSKGYPKSDLYTLDLSGGTWLHFTFEDQQINIYPVWSHDGRTIIYAAGDPGNTALMRRAVDGTGGVEALIGERPAFPMSLSPDGKLLVYRTGGTSNFDLKVLDLATREARPLFVGPTDALNAEVSPDGHFIAYQSRESSNQYQVYVRPFPNVTDGQWQVSTGAVGTEPLWSRDGRELFYRDLARMMTVPVETSSGFRSGTPTELFSGSYMSVIGRSYDVAPDGRFLMVEQDATADALRVVLVQNFGEELKRLLPVK